MKLTPEQKRLEALKLDGKTLCDKWTPMPLGLAGMHYTKNCECPNCVPNIEGFWPKYDNYNEVIPLIQKQDEALVEKITELLASDRVDRLTATDVLFSAPSQLLDALLVAKGFEV